MFDNERFGQAVVTDSDFDSFGENHLHYSYSWKYENPPAEMDGKEAVDMSNDFREKLVEKTIDAELYKTTGQAKSTLVNYVPLCLSNPILFSGDEYVSSLT